MLGGAALSLRRGELSGGLRKLLQPAQAMVDRRLRQLHAAGQLAKVQLRVLSPPPRHLTQRRRQAVHPALRLEALDGGRLAQARSNRLADVRRLEVEPAVDLAAHL